MMQDRAMVTTER